MKDAYKKLSIYHFAGDIKKYRKNKQLRVVIFGNFGAKNTGDEAILAGQLQELKHAKPTSVTVVARFPKEVAKLHKVSAISMLSLAQVFQVIWDADVVIVGGGGIISKVERHIIGFLYQLYIECIFFGLPRLLHKPSYALGVGIYDNANKFNLWLAVKLLRSFNKVTVRDFHSFDLLKSKKVPAILYKDNSFLLSVPTKQQMLAESLFKKFYNSKRKNIGISLMNPETKAEKERMLKEIIRFVRLNHKKADFWFYSLDSHTSYVNDKAFGQELQTAIKREIGSRVVFHFIPETLKPEMIFGSLQLMDFVVTQRLHGAIFAYRFGLNFAGISYDRKGTSFLTSVGKPVFEAKTITANKLQAQFKQKKHKSANLSTKQVSNAASSTIVSVL